MQVFEGLGHVEAGCPRNCNQPHNFCGVKVLACSGPGVIPVELSVDLHQRCQAHTFVELVQSTSTAPAPLEARFGRLQRRWRRLWLGGALIASLLLSSEHLLPDSKQRCLIGSS
jgi:hypothetical protein